MRRTRAVLKLQVRKLLYLVTLGLVLPQAISSNALPDMGSSGAVLLAVAAILSSKTASSSMDVDTHTWVFSIFHKLSINT
jgi:uncharacterized membrane protein